MAHSVAETTHPTKPRSTLRPNVLRVLLGAHLLAVARITLWPELADPATLAGLGRLLAWAHAQGLPEGIDLVVVEALANVAMFVPMGVLVPLTFGWVARRRWLAVAVGAGTSTAIELAQLLFLPARVPTVQDVLLNTAGAALGVLALQIRYGRERRRPDKWG